MWRWLGAAFVATGAFLSALLHFSNEAADLAGKFGLPVPLMITDRVPNSLNGLTPEAQMRLLEMVQNGVLTPAEAEKLARAINGEMEGAIYATAQPFDSWTDVPAITRDIRSGGETAGGALQSIFTAISSYRDFAQAAKGQSDRLGQTGPNGLPPCHAQPTCGRAKARCAPPTSGRSRRRRQSLSKGFMVGEYS